LTHLSHFDKFFHRHNHTLLLTVKNYNNESG
jgi:hypothetical protein